MIFDQEAFLSHSSDHEDGGEAAVSSGGEAPAFPAIEESPARRREKTAERTEVKNKER